MAVDISFHNKSKAVKPQLQTKSTTYWAAILLADKEPDDVTTEEDYLWIKCSQKVTVEKICKEYNVRYPDQDIALRHDGTFPSKDKTMKELDSCNDRVIAFWAVRKSDIERPGEISPQPPPRQPRQPRKQRNTPPGLAIFANNPKPSRVLKDRTALGINNPRNFDHPDLYKSSYLTQDENVPPDNLRASSVAKAAKFIHYHGPPPLFPLQSPGSLMYADFRSSPGSGQAEAAQGQNAAFQGYLADFRVHFFGKYVPSSGIPSDEGFIQFQAWDAWKRLTNAQRMLYLDSKYTAFTTESSLMQMQEGSPSDSSPAGSNTSVDQQPVVSSTLSETNVAFKEEEDASDLDFKDQFTHPDDPASQTEVVQSQSFHLQNIVAGASLDVLEASVERGVKFLDDLKQPLVDHLESPDAAQWVQQIERLQKQAVKTKTVIGVVGNTGAGKSSVINAMLDEERLVPTNTMRACTAVVTELSYNYDDNSYRAEVEFISAADWEKELRILFQDLLDVNGTVSRECANEDSDAGIAYAKIKAVYPKKTKEDISNSSIEQMLRDVSHVLGQTKKFEEDNSAQFYKHLQCYVDSKEKATGKKDSDKKKKKEPKQMEFWPLIKVVRIFVRSECLAGGAVICDLPGVHDANAARAAVAESYMKQCTGLWIVAPIIRAVDDKAAKNLLGESFKRQLKMDGGFNSVTFICSKTDDISLTEASDSLGLESENGLAWEEMENYARKQKELEKDLYDLNKTKEISGEVLQDVEDQLEIWEALRDKKQDGSTVYAPTQDKKRKKAAAEGSRKKQRRSSDDEDEDYDDAKTSDDEEDEDDENMAVSQGSPLTDEDISLKINELRTTKKTARRQRAELGGEMENIKAEIAKVKEAQTKVENQISKVCIEGRNAYSKGAIQQDFAAGMKELDQELAAEDDEENFNPDTDIRDYDEVARSLPVFCVSSRGYQKLQGRLKKDPPVPGFQTLEETEVPQLQAHCKSLTVAGRTTTCKRFMTNLSQLLNSMVLWASNDGTGVNITADQRAQESRFLLKNLGNLERGLEKVVTTVVGELKNEIENNIFDKYDTAIANAIKDSTETCSKWGWPVNREDRPAGGYHYSTYKAICRRNGVYTNAQGPHDWNTTLSDPMLKVIAGGWERTFSRRSPIALAAFARNAHNLLKAFHHEINERALKIGVAFAGLDTLRMQLETYEHTFKDLATTTIQAINTQQKDINREFIPVIGRAMIGGYDACTNESGIGSYRRMKDHMHEHVDQVRHTMFSESAEEVRNRLKIMLRQIEELMANKADEVFMQMSRDYQSVLGGGDIVHEALTPKWQRRMRKDVKAVIDRAEKIFKRVAGVKVEEDEAEKDVEATPGTEAKIEEGGESANQVNDEDAEVAPTTVGYGADTAVESSNKAFYKTETTPQWGGPANVDVHAKYNVEESNRVTEADPKSPNVASSPIGSAELRVAPESTADAGAGIPGARYPQLNTHSGNTTDKEDSSVGFESGDSDASH